MKLKDDEYIKMKMREELSNTYFTEDAEARKEGYITVINDLEDILETAINDLEDILESMLNEQ